MDYIINSLFPTPIFQSDIGREITNEESNYFQETMKETIPNTGNHTSSRTDVLEDPAMADLKNTIMDAIDTYVKDIIAPRNPLEMYITQSWLNETNKDGYHHKHSHANSLISGVFYPHANSDTDKIYMFHPNPWWDQPIKILSDNYNDYNSISWWIPVHTGNIVLFPSALQHSVETLSTEKRVSLAFNTWFRGTVGDEKNLTELKMT